MKRKSHRKPQPVKAGLVQRLAKPGKGPLVPSREVWTRYGICDRTLDRWLAKPELGFPKPLVFNRRRYFYLSELEAWERRHAAGKDAA